MGLQNQVAIESILTGKTVEDLITEALATSKNQTEAAAKLNISRQALSRRLSRIKRSSTAAPQRADAAPKAGAR